MSRLKPICVPCQRFFRPKMNGYHFIERMPRTGNPAPGTSEPDKWKPYKLWVGDVWACQGCGAEIIVGCAGPIAEHYQPEFAWRVKERMATLQINDC